MPSKSRKKRGKYIPPAPKKKSRPSRSATAIQQSAVAQSQESVGAHSPTTPQIEVPTPTVKPAEVEYPFLVTELRNIGVLAAIMLAILVLLAVFLP